MSVTILPPQLKMCSAATLVSHKHKYFRASFATVGYVTASIFHQLSGDSSISKVGGLSIGLVLASPIGKGYTQ